MADAPTFDVTLSEINIVNPETGELMSPEAFVDAARNAERAIGRLDMQIDDASESLKQLKAARNEAIAVLRALVRDSSTKELPLFTRPDDSADSNIEA